jgi:hypothetical protein
MVGIIIMAGEPFSFRCVVALRSLQVHRCTRHVLRPSLVFIAQATTLASANLVQLSSFVQYRRYFTSLRETRCIRWQARYLANPSSLFWVGQESDHDGGVRTIFSPYTLWNHEFQSAQSEWDTSLE